ncbi:hypothetical protein LDH19_17400, partial [Mycobacterium tuberculosis]
PPVELEAAYY